MNKQQWHQAITLLPSLTRDKAYWKVKGWQIGFDGGRNCPLANDFMIEHLWEYFNYEPEIQPVWRQ